MEKGTNVNLYLNGTTLVIRSLFDNGLNVLRLRGHGSRGHYFFKVAIHAW